MALLSLDTIWRFVEPGIGFWVFSADCDDFIVMALAQARSELARRS